VNQVLLNLCVNSRDALPNGGHLTIGAENRLLDEKYSSFNSAAKPGRYVQFSVTDTGTGMTREVADKIFEPFFTTKELHKGTGLGLSTVMAIVKGHEGLVNVYSEPGIGTTMKVFLPAVNTSFKPNEQKPDRREIMKGSGETVLVVDDEPDNIALISKALNTFGYRVLTAGNGAEGVRVYSENINEISAVLTDMTMPVMDGATMIHALREMNPAVKVIAASGLGPSEQSLPGVDHFLEKPYGVKALLSVVRRLLDS
jgi:CheY-like chemotaxis protein